MTAIAAAAERDPRWDGIVVRAPRMADTMLSYLDQMGVSLRPASIDAIELALRGFADYATMRVLGTVYGRDRSLLDIGPFKMGYEEVQRIQYLFGGVQQPLAQPAGADAEAAAVLELGLHRLAGQPQVLRDLPRRPLPRGAWRAPRLLAQRLGRGGELGERRAMLVDQLTPAAAPRLLAHRASRPAAGAVRAPTP